MTAANFIFDRVKPASNKVYLFHPLVDLSLVCGGWLFLLVTVNYFLSGQNFGGQATIPDGMRLLALVGTYLIAQPHTASTLYKLYGERESIKRHSFVALILPLIMSALLILALFVPLIARLCATAYVGLALHHVMAQCYGIAVMYCARANISLTALERRLMQTAMWIAVSSAVSQQLSMNWHRHTLLGIQLFQLAGIPSGLVLGLQIAALLTMIFLAYLQLKRYFHNQGVMPMPAVLTMLSAISLLTIWNAAGDFVWLFVPPFFHGSQYLCVTMSYFLKKETSENSGKTKMQYLEFAALRMSELFIVGLILFLGIPKLLSMTGPSFALCSGVMFLVINFHHFAADACIWKLRQPSVRQSLIE